MSSFENNSNTLLNNLNKMKVKTKMIKFQLTTKNKKMRKKTNLKMKTCLKVKTLNMRMTMNSSTQKWKRCLVGKNGSRQIS